MNKLEIVSDNQDTVCNTFVGDTLNDCALLHLMEMGYVNAVQLCQNGDLDRYNI